MSEYELLPEGDYDVRVSDRPTLRKNNKGDSQVCLTLEIVSQGRYKGWSKPMFLSLSQKPTDKAPEGILPFTLKRLELLGWDGTVNDQAELGGAFRNVVGAYVKHETYEGKTRDALNISLPRETNFKQPLAAPGDIAAFRNLTKGFGAQPQTHDDIPF